MSNDNSGKRILVDAAYVDEIRVAVLDDGKVVEFDQELKDRKQLRGNVYYAVVKRIEPSLQAVFIEYGISKHGFLPFSEISVEHYQLPTEEKEALLQSMYGDGQEHEGLAEADGAAAPLPDDGPVDACKPQLDDRSGKRDASSKARSKSSLHKLYKIQDVIKVDQKLMVQIIKEERGNKCATFSTYIALVGRYCIFMPNAGNKNSGISRRIEDCDDRKNLKEVLNSIKLPKESGVIIRTAGSNRSQKEIEQDLSYLQSTWQEIRDNCEKVEPPALLYVEANIIKRALRDFCDETIHDVVVSGSRAFSLVKEYAKSMFRNKLRVRMYKGSVPIFTHYRVDAQILELYSDKIFLPSGGYLVITPTEALVSIDVNSGKMTGEDSIEETAYKTNMEAVKEIARQVNLRGLSGLIVIDFIDMLRYRYCRAVEAEVREAFKNDKAKVQFGYISAFGLMEISRQRVKQSILDTNTVQCAHCRGVGRVRSFESVAADMLRDVRCFAHKNREKIISVLADPGVLTYLFNHKRKHIWAIEGEFKVLIRLGVSENPGAAGFSIHAEKGYSTALSEELMGPPEAQPELAESKADNAEIANVQETVQEAFVGVKKPDGTWVKKWLSRMFADIR
ncbi:Rne/Rng family ribonuclease [Anaplasma marginale]|uniref:Rne/Rng family ribonuclease n=1 Tax=Anaplasma marginale TaxID=770 RepID=A0A643CLG3_ANAMA|nr:Rne/Rng family ribonuclease [Anaplasma marginale]KAA8474763.1 Rne/Rng family ribonuclease [Anaplasma marginale]KAB0452332.1 Rne/Rng family ribonuclease [Anaplasma marginale]